MLLSKFNGATLRRRLAKLDSTRQLIFGALCCERLVPNYLAFQADAGWGHVAAVRKGLDLVWASINGLPPNLKDVELATIGCEAAAPTSEVFSSIYVTSAQDACFAICCLLDFLKENDVDKIVQVATYGTDSVDLYVQEIEGMASSDPQLEQKILGHHLMQRELAQQEADLGTIEAIGHISVELIQQLKESWSTCGKGNLEIGGGGN